MKSAVHYKLDTFEFNDFVLSDDETILASIRMMLELDFLNAVHAKQEVSGVIIWNGLRWLYVVTNEGQADKLSLLLFHDWMAC